MLQYVKIFAVQFHSYSQYVSVDEANIPLADPIAIIRLSTVSGAIIIL